MTPVIYGVDARHSQLHLELDHLGGVSVLVAGLAGFSGRLQMDEVSGSVALTAVAESATVASALPELDQLLRGPAMLDANAFPHIKLTLASFTGSTAGSKTAAKVTIRGIEKECGNATATLRRALNRRGAHVAGVRVSLSVQRSAFGMDMSKSPTLGDELRLVFNVEASEEVVVTDGR